MQVVMTVMLGNFTTLVQSKLQTYMIDLKAWGWRPQVVRTAPAVHIELSLHSR